MTKSCIHKDIRNRRNINGLNNVEDDIREEATHTLEKMEEEREHEILYSESGNNDA